MERSGRTQGRRSQRLTAVDLFSGCGGLTLGLKRAGFRVIGAVDNDPLAVETYKANHPRVKVWPNDIRSVSAAELKKTLGLRKGQLGLLAGCPPCQGFSALRTRNGAHAIRDARNDLIFEFARFVEELLPRGVMLENVPGLAGDRRFARFRQQLRRLGYFVISGVFDAASYGVPQRRRRLILLASRVSPLQFPRASSRRRTVRQAFAGLPPAGMSGDPLHDLPEKRATKTSELIRRIPKDGGSRASLGPAAQLSCHKRMDGFKDIYGRMKWSDVAPTITSGCTNPSKGRFLHPDENRALTLREAALLQAFPRSYKISLGRGKSGAATLIGNALPPTLVKWHALELRRALLNERRCETELR